MSKQKKSGALTIADIVNAVGVVLLGIACFLGYNYSTLGNLTISLVAAILIMGISYGIIQFIAYAKIQDSFFMKWRIIEYGGLFIYLLWFSLIKVLLTSDMWSLIVKSILKN